MWVTGGDNRHWSKGGGGGADQISKKKKDTNTKQLVVRERKGKDESEKKGEKKGSPRHKKTNYLSTPGRSKNRQIRKTEKMVSSAKKARGAQK